MGGLSTLLRETPESPLTPSRGDGHNEQGADCSLWEGPHQTPSDGLPGLALQPRELRGVTFCGFRAPLPGALVTAAGGTETPGLYLGGGFVAAAEIGWSWGIQPPRSFLRGFED